MDPINFAYFIQSLFEVANKKSFTLAETKIIKQHALLVLKTVEINENKNKKINQTRPGLPLETPSNFSLPKRYAC